MMTIATALMAADQHISDEELVLYILDGLGSDFESVFVNLTSRESVSLQEVQYSLQTHEMRLEQLSATSVVEFSNVESRVTQKQFHPLGSGFRGHQANFRGRSGRRGPGRNQSGGRSYLSSNGHFNKKLMCQICGKSGHTASKFYISNSKGSFTAGTGSSQLALHKNFCSLLKHISPLQV